jgi:hypothetical protein
MSEDMDILDVILDQEVIINQIYDRYERYKRADRYFYVPVDVKYKNGVLKFDIGDKSYRNRNKLREVLETWFTDKIDSDNFERVFWNHAEKNIIAMILIETDEYNTLEKGSFFGLTEKYNIGYLIHFPLEKDQEIEILFQSDIKKFHHINPEYMNN